MRTSRAKYALTNNFTGANFWPGFDFFTLPDPTQGHVQYLSMSQANSTPRIAGMVKGTVYLGVEHERPAPDGRRSVRVQSKQKFQHGLFIVDIAHMPDSICGVWPAYWMLGDQWPDDGEIDILEYVNLMTHNSIALHTSQDMIIANSTAFNGQLISANCNTNAMGQPKNSGCQILDLSGKSLGAEFNKGRGGIYATEWTSAFIKIWFFPRGQFPQDIAYGRPSPGDGWGQTVATFQGNFSIDDHFRNLRIVFNTAFCGSWAGQVWPQSPCASSASSCNDYVTNNPSAFENAYWAINDLLVYQQDLGTQQTAVPIEETTPAESQQPSQLLR